MKKKIILIIFITFIISLFTINYFIDFGTGSGAAKKNDKISTIKSYFTSEQIQLIKKYIFPYKMIDQQKEQLNYTYSVIYRYEKVINNFERKNLFHELEVLKDKQDIRILKNTKLSNNKTLKVYHLTKGFRYGINSFTSGSGYIDFHNNNLLVLSSRGILAFSKNIDDENNLQQIENNISDFIGLKQFIKSPWFSIKDMYIHEDQIFVSYTDEIQENCWNISVLQANINYESIKFKKIFSSKGTFDNQGTDNYGQIYGHEKLSKECHHRNNNIDIEFNAHQSGGRIANFDSNHILLSLGDFRKRWLAQDTDNPNGKIIKLNINTSDYEIVSMGHRNAQGMYFDKENNFILETEHGPKDADEINLIELDKMNQDKPLNYGWPIVSAGEHYRWKDRSKPKPVQYEEYPLYKSHTKHGFIEPLKEFTPSIGISEITKIGKNRYVTSSMKDKSLYFFELDNQKKIINLNRVEVFERIRDLRFKDNKLYLFLENTATIGVISLN